MVMDSKQRRAWTVATSKLNTEQVRWLKVRIVRYDGSFFHIEVPQGQRERVLRIVEWGIRDRFYENRFRM